MAAHDRIAKRLLVTAGALAMLIATGCGDPTGESTSPSPSAETAQAPSPTEAAESPGPTVSEVATTQPSVSADASSNEPDQSDVSLTSGIEYAPPHDLDVYAPSQPGPWPVVIVVHGLGQGRNDFAGLAEAIAAEGAVVFNISVVFSVPPLDAIEDIACAVRFARATAPDFDGDPDSITLVGNSSGAAKGSIVAMDGDSYGGDCVVEQGSALPDALVGYEGPFDYATHLYGSFAVPALQQADPETWEAVDPYSQIGGNPELVVRLVHGRDDDVAWYDVLPEVSTRFHDALAAAGYDVQVTFIDGAGHGALRPGSAAFDLTVQEVIETAGA